MTAPRIVLVDDSPQDAALALAVFDEENIADDVIVLRDGEAALAYLLPAAATAAPAPRVVLLDVKMPKLDGLQVLAKLRDDARTKIIPVVMLTSSREERDIVASYARGCNAYVVKHLDFDAFARSLKALGGFWLGVNHPAPHEPHVVP